MELLVKEVSMGTKDFDDIIVAIATPGGEGGIGIVRMSGEGSKEILGAIFRSARGSNAEIRPRELTYGHIQDPKTGEDVDEVLVCYMPAPATYTKEDVVEINCHGGTLPLSRVMEIILSMGARMAEPGEFTKRAFLNGRIDLAQAEAVIDVINAKTDASLDAAIVQLQGKYSKEIEAIRKNLTDTLVDIGVNIDYPDEDIEEITYEKLTKSLEKVKKEIGDLLESATAGKILRDGLAVSIVGKPNAGKSSLLNLLLREARAIVTEIPGTTRDTIEEFCNIKGIPVKLTDTAGIRKTDDKIEAMGIERSKKSLEGADIAILVVDSTEEVDQETIDLLLHVIPMKTILLLNKRDLSEGISPSLLTEIAARRFGKILETSLISDEDLPKIEEAIFELSGYGPKGEAKGNQVVEGHPRRTSGIVTNTRHKAMLSNALRSIKDALAAAEANAPLELIEIDVRSAYEELGFITGDSVQEDIIEEIFSRFCLGK